MKYLSELIRKPGRAMDNLYLPGWNIPMDRKPTVHLLALGDVGGTLLTGLKTLGGGLIGEIGIYDISMEMMKRYEQEMNQISWAFEENALPKVRILKEEELFQGDVFLFCASRATPAAGEKVTEVRMAQYQANKPLVEHFAKMAGNQGFKGLFGVVSDPVDPLCKAALTASGLQPGQIRGYGLGVMNSRAVYYAGKDPRFHQFLQEGRVFGPHGNDLVVADSVENYNPDLSLELTRLTIESNLRTRELGFKPYIAPAYSSGVLSILNALQGKWHYSSFYLGEGDNGAFLGAKNRLVDGQTEVENLPLPKELYERIEQAYLHLCQL